MNKNRLFFLLLYKNFQPSIPSSFIWPVFWVLILAHLPSDIIREAFTTCAAAYHQGAMGTFWHLHESFWKLVCRGCRGDSLPPDNLTCTNATIIKVKERKWRLENVLLECTIKNKTVFLEKMHFFLICACLSAISRNHRMFSCQNCQKSEK